MYPRVTLSNLVILPTDTASYTGGPTSSELNYNQLSFKRGDILEVSRILDKKWWPARTQDGEQGSAYLILFKRRRLLTVFVLEVAPSNYLDIIPESSAGFR